jgi:hypothetical protein
MKRTWIKENETIGTNKVDTASSSFTREKKDKLFAFRVIELIHEFLPFCNRHGPVQAEVIIS